MNINANRSTHACSQCGQSGHNVRTCGHARLARVERRVNRRVTDDLIREFEFECARRVQDNRLNEYLESEIDIEPGLITAFAIKKCGATNTSSRLDIIRFVNIYINNTYVYGARDIYDIFQEHTAFRDPETFQFNNILQEIEENTITEENAAYYDDDEEREEVTDITIRSMEYALRRELVLFTMSNILTDFITAEDNANSKLNVLCNVNNDENEDIHKLCECNICYEEKEVKNFVKLNCNHEFCSGCIINQVKARQSTPTICCAMCRTEVKEIQCRTNDIKSEFNEYIV